MKTIRVITTSVKHVYNNAAKPRLKFSKRKNIPKIDVANSDAKLINSCKTLIAILISLFGKLICIPVWKIETRIPLAVPQIAQMVIIVKAVADVVKNVKANIMLEKITNARKATNLKSFSFATTKPAIAANIKDVMPRVVINIPVSVGENP